MLWHGRQPEGTGPVAKGPGGRRVGRPGCRPGVGAEVPRLPGGVRHALDRARAVVRGGDVPALDAAGRFGRFALFPGRETSGWPQGTPVQKGDRTVQNQVVGREEWLAARRALLEEEKELT